MGATVQRHVAVTVHHGKHPSRETGVIDVTLAATIPAVLVIGIGARIAKRALRIRFRSEQIYPVIVTMLGLPSVLQQAATSGGAWWAWFLGIVTLALCIAWIVHAERNERSRLSTPELQAMLLDFKDDIKQEIQVVASAVRELLETRESIEKVTSYSWLRDQPREVSRTFTATSRVIASASAVIVRPQVAFPASATIITSEQLAIDGKKLASKILYFLESRERSHLVVLREGGGLRPDEKRIRRARRIEDAAIVEFQNKWQLEAERYLRHVEYPNVSGQIECRPISSFSDIKKMADQISTGAEMFADRANLVTLQKENNADE